MGADPHMQKHTQPPVCTAKSQATWSTRLSVRNSSIPSYTHTHKHIYTNSCIYIHLERHQLRHFCNDCAGVCVDTHAHTRVPGSISQHVSISILRRIHICITACSHRGTHSDPLSHTRDSLSDVTHSCMCHDSFI